MTDILPFMSDKLDSDAPEGDCFSYNYWSVTESGDDVQDQLRGAAYCELAAERLREDMKWWPEPVLGQPYNPGRLFREVFFAMTENGQSVRPIEAGFIVRAARFAIRADPFGGPV